MVDDGEKARCNEGGALKRDCWPLDGEVHEVHDVASNRKQNELEWKGICKIEHDMQGYDGLNDITENESLVRMWKDAEHQSELT